MSDFEALDQKMVKQIIRELAISFKYKNGNTPIKSKNLNDRVAIKNIKNEKLRKALYYVPDAKFKVFHGNLGKNSYNVYIHRKLLNKIFKTFELKPEVYQD